MNHDSQNIKRIVERVLQELQRPSIDAPAVARRLVIDDKVVSLDRVENKLDDVDTIQFKRGAIVTPSVRDLLREKGVTIAFGSGKCSCGCKTCKVVQFKNGSSCVFPNHEVVTAKTHEEAIQFVTERVAGGSGVLLIAAETAAFQVLLNRNSLIRAVVVDSAESLKKCVTEIAANVAIVDSNRSSSAIERIVTAFDQKPRSVPPEYKELI